MGIANFHVQNIHYPLVTLEELYNLLDDLEGVMDWTANIEGEIAIEYDHNRIRHQEIEEALTGIGLQLENIFDDPNVPDVGVREVLSKVEV